MKLSAKILNKVWFLTQFYPSKCQHNYIYSQKPQFHLHFFIYICTLYVEKDCLYKWMSILYHLYQTIAAPKRYIMTLSTYRLIEHNSDTVKKYSKIHFLIQGTGRRYIVSVPLVARTRSRFAPNIVLLKILHQIDTLQQGIARPTVPPIVLPHFPWLGFRGPDFRMSSQKERSLLIGRSILLSRLTTADWTNWSRFCFSWPSTVDRCSAVMGFDWSRAAIASSRYLSKIR